VFLLAKFFRHGYMWLKREKHFKNIFNGSVNRK